MKSNLFILLLFAICLISCGHAHDENTSESTDEEMQVEDFMPKRGDHVDQIADVPGVTWTFDTIFGICAPDTIVLWMSYGGTDFMTNVYGVGGDYQLLTRTGLNRIGKDLKDTDFKKVDFSPYAQLITDGSLTESDFKVLRDSALARSCREMCRVAYDFFNSQGMIKYMSQRLANNWRIILNQSEFEAEMAPNPFNGGSVIEFAPGSITVQVADANAGILEVSAYCNDSRTLGYPGWAYWTVIMCREGNQYKVKEMPAQHRKFVTG